MLPWKRDRLLRDVIFLKMAPVHFYLRRCYHKLQKCNQNSQYRVETNAITHVKCGTETDHTSCMKYPFMRAQFYEHGDDAKLWRMYILVGASQTCVRVCVRLSRCVGFKKKSKFWERKY